MYVCCIFHSGKEERLQPIAQSLNYKSKSNQKNKQHVVDAYILQALIFYRCLYFTGAYTACDNAPASHYGYQVIRTSY